jgi:hypothetical protein
VICDDSIMKDSDCDGDADDAGGEVTDGTKPAGKAGKRAHAAPSASSLDVRGEVSQEIGNVAYDGDDSGGGGGWRPLPPPRLRAQAVKVEFTQLEMPHLPARWMP